MIEGSESGLRFEGCLSSENGVLLKDSTANKNCDLGDFFS
jgi:hypothetical protein